MQDPFDRDAWDALYDAQSEDAEEQEKIRREQIRVQESKTQLRYVANRVGWATAALIGVWVLSGIFLSTLAELADMVGGGGFVAFFDRFLLIINELTLAAALCVAAVVLLPVRRVNLHKEAISFGRFLKFFMICLGAGYVGNLIGSVMLSFWNASTGNTVGDELVTLLSDGNPWLMVLSAAVLAPILEELFFRKLLTDRLRVFGETPSILLTALLFALFHQSAEQFIYAFALGILMGYFYCRTGNYWLTVLLHALFNFTMGVVPVLFLNTLSKFSLAMTEAFGADLSGMESMESDALLEAMMPILERYGLPIMLYALYAIAILALEIAGIVLFAIRFGKFKERKGEYSLPLKEAMKIVFKTPGVIFCTVAMSLMTVASLFL